MIKQKKCLDVEKHHHRKRARKWILDFKKLNYFKKKLALGFKPL